MGFRKAQLAICPPARSPALRGEGRGIFDQPEKNEFSNRLLYHPTRNSKKNPELLEMIALTR
jgi:hypothetical protein